MIKPSGAPDLNDETLKVEDLNKSIAIWKKMQNSQGVDKTYVTRFLHKMENAKTKLIRFASSEIQKYVNGVYASTEKEPEKHAKLLRAKELSDADYAKSSVEAVKSLNNAEGISLNNTGLKGEQLYDKVGIGMIHAVKTSLAVAALSGVVAAAGGGALFVIVAQSVVALAGIGIAAKVGHKLLEPLAKKHIIRYRTRQAYNDAMLKEHEDLKKIPTEITAWKQKTKDALINDIMVAFTDRGGLTPDEKTDLQKRYVTEGKLSEAEFDAILQSQGVRKDHGFDAKKTLFNDKVALKNIKDIFKAHSTLQPLFNTFVETYYEVQNNLKTLSAPTDRYLEVNKLKLALDNLVNEYESKNSNQGLPKPLQEVCSAMVSNATAYAKDGTKSDFDKEDKQRMNLERSDFNRLSTYKQANTTSQELKDFVLDFKLATEDILKMKAADRNKEFAARIKTLDDLNKKIPTTDADTKALIQTLKEYITQLQTFAKSSTKDAATTQKEAYEKLAWTPAGSGAKKLSDDGKRLEELGFNETGAIKE